MADAVLEDTATTVRLIWVNRRVWTSVDHLHHGHNISLECVEQDNDASGGMVLGLIIKDIKDMIAAD